MAVAIGKSVAGRSGRTDERIGSATMREPSFAALALAVLSLLIVSATIVIAVVIAYGGENSLVLLTAAIGMLLTLGTGIMALAKADLAATAAEDARREAKKASRHAERAADESRQTNETLESEDYHR